MKSFAMRSGATLMKVTAIAHANGDSYDIELTTKLDDITSTYLLGSNTNLNKGNIKKIDKFMEYMKRASELFNRQYVEMTPHYIDVVVYQ